MAESWIVRKGTPKSGFRYAREDGRVLRDARALARIERMRVPPAWRERFRLHCAGALIEVAGGMFRRQERRWPERVAEAVQEAQNVLSGGFM